MNGQKDKSKPLQMSMAELIKGLMLDICSNVRWDVFRSEPEECTFQQTTNAEYLQMECQLLLTIAKGSTTAFPSSAHYLFQPGTYYMEVHFDFALDADLLNVHEIDAEGIGIRLFYEEEPRAHQIGLITFEGVEFEVPPKRRDYEISFAMHPGPAVCTLHICSF